MSPNRPPPLMPPNPPSPRRARCPSCGVQVTQEHLSGCPLGPGEYTASQRRSFGDMTSHGGSDEDQMRIVEEIKRIDQLPESKRKHRRKKRLLLQLDPKFLKHLES